MSLVDHVRILNFPSFDEEAFRRRRAHARTECHMIEKRFLAATRGMNFLKTILTECHLLKSEKSNAERRTYSARLIRTLRFAILTKSYHISIAGGKTPDVTSRTYTQIMQEQMLKGEENEVRLKG